MTGISLRIIQDKQALHLKSKFNLKPVAVKELYEIRDKSITSEHNHFLVYHDGQSDLYGVFSNLNLFLDGTLDESQTFYPLRYI